MRLAFLVLLFAVPAAAEDIVITGETNIAVGAADVGAIDGFAAPVGHFNVGISFRNLRAQGEADIGLWSTDQADEDRSMAGSFKRLGWAARYYWMNLDVGRPGVRGPQRLRLYVEGGFGQQWIKARGLMNGQELAVSRPDVAFGFGMAQEADLGPVVLGGHFGLRVHVTGAPDEKDGYTACRGACAKPSSRPYDVALFFVLGLVVGS